MLLGIVTPLELSGYIGVCNEQARIGEYTPHIVPTPLVSPGVGQKRELDVQVVVVVQVAGVPANGDLEFLVVVPKDTYDRTGDGTLAEAYIGLLDINEC